MAAISTAVGLERRARVAGYRITKGFFNDTSANLNQIIAIFGEANTANQGTLDTAKRKSPPLKKLENFMGLVVQFIKF